MMIELFLHKVEIIRSLEISLPAIFYYLGMYYAESGKVAEAKNMFRTSINANDFSDELDEDDFFYEAAQVAKKDAVNNLKYLET
ncbi:MAG: hypothetical protein M3430_05335 [Acidobacteriota bacterium]|nr:hypothetical protein [Acidobacteriota bacterium]